MLVLLSDSIIDGIEDGARSGAVVIGDDGLIAGVEARIEAPSDAIVVELEGATVLPGLIDCHVHLGGMRTMRADDESFVSEGLRAARATADAAALLQAGFTTVRDCGSYAAIDIKRAVEEGSIPGPRILAAGRFVEPTGGIDDPMHLPLDLVHQGYGPYGVRLADGVTEVRRAVREQFRAGADLIKTCSTGPDSSHADPGQLEWTDEELAALIDEAHRRGRRVAVHATSSAGILQAVACGADTIEHGTFLDQRAAEELAAREVPLVLTLSRVEQFSTKGAELGVEASLLERVRGRKEGHAQAAALAIAADVPLAMGTDCTGDPLLRFGENAFEIELMVRAGVGSAVAIRAATSVAAGALGVEDVTGSLEAGKRADLIVVPRDPLADVSALSDVRLVVQGGAVVSDVDGLVPAGSSTYTRVPQHQLARQVAGATAAGS